jgi:hypothetical protein
MKTCVKVHDTEGRDRSLATRLSMYSVQQKMPIPSGWKSQLLFRYAETSRKADRFIIGMFFFGHIETCGWNWASGNDNKFQIGPV